MSLKNIIKKSVAMGMTISILSGNCSLSGIGLLKVIAEDANAPEIIAQVENEKYVQYQYTKLVQEEEQEKEVEIKGVAIQSKLSISSEYNQDTYLPTELVEIKINLPSINECLPEKASIVESKTQSTTGEELNKNINQNYDSSSGLLTMSYENIPNEEGNIYSSYNENARDEFEIIYSYPAEAYVGNEEEIKLSYTVNSRMIFKTENGSVVSENSENIELIEKENRSDISSFGVTDLKEPIYKGFLYSNVANKTEYDTEYKTVSTFCVLNSSLIDEPMIMELKESKFVLNDEEETEISSNGNVVYKTTGVSKDEFDKILGQDGSIEFYLGENVIATVKYVEVDEEGTKKLAVTYSEEDTVVLNDEDTTAIIEYPENLVQLKAKISEPIAEGFIHFENQNAIKASEDYGANVGEIKYISTEGIVNEVSNNTKIELKEPETKISVTSSNSNFSTLQNNKTTLTINLDSTNASTRLFDKPVITVKLPEGLTGGNLSSPTILNGNGLTIKKAKADNNAITITLEGKQTTYDLNNVSGGASIVMDIENLEFNDILPTHEDRIEVSCKQGEEIINAKCDVNIVSKSGLLMISKLNNYNEENENTSTMDSDLKTVQIDGEAEEREVIHTLSLVNNYDENLTDVQMIGRIDYSNDNIQSTFDTELKEIKISDKNAKVYYSTNINASYEDESWQEEYTSEAKVVKVALNNNELEKASSREIKTYIKVPANLGSNQENYFKWDIVYSYKESAMQTGTTFGMLTNKEELEINTTQIQENLATPYGVNVPITLSITPCITEDYVHSGQLVIYKIQVKNNSNEDLTDLILEDIIPENAIYTYRSIVEKSLDMYVVEATKDIETKLKTWDIEVLKAGESQEFQIGLTMSETNTQQEVINKVQLKYNDQIISEESILILQPSKVTVMLGTSPDEVLGTGEVYYDLGDRVEYRIRIKNTTSNVLRNVKVTKKIQEGMTYINGGLAEFVEFEGYNITEVGELLDNGNFEYNINELQAGEEKTVTVICEIQRLQDINTLEVESIANVVIGDEIYQSNMKSINIAQAAYEMSLSSNIPEGQVLKVGDNVIYTINIKNIGAKSGTFTLKDSIPSQIEVNQIEYKNLEGETNKIATSSQEIETNITLDVGESKIIKITGKVREQEVQQTTIFEMTNVAKIVIGQEEILSNEVKLKLKIEEQKQEDNIVEDNVDDSNQNQDNEQENNAGNNENQENDSLNNNTSKEENTLYTISGIAWIDENKDGKKDENEKLQEGVIVSLINKDIGNFALDANGNRIKVTTDNEGKYIFNNLPKGNYLVLFEFDTSTYTVSTYKKSGIGENINSDAILTTVTIDGTKKKAAITDGIVLDSNKGNINIGLMENAIFDLSLDKRITKTTVINSQGTEIAEYEDGDVAKVDLVAKYMNGADVIVNYKFTVMNEGDVTGYVDSLVDDLPSGLEFSSELNENWYKGNDGKLYTTSLSEKVIKPGETIEIELVLTKKMTEENTGVFPNSAKLEKISNLENIEEKENALDNNQSSATLFISIKTGSVIMYLGITTLCIGIILIGAYLTKKKILSRGI